MGIFGTIGKIAVMPVKVVAFPLKFLFGRIKKKETLEAQPAYPTQQYTQPASQGQLPDVAADNLKAKIDLMMSQVDSLKLEYEAMNQRIQNIERMVRELYAMAKS